MRSREYKAIKNFVHNELGLTKLDCENLFKEAIKEESKSFVQRQFQKDEQKFVIIATESVKKEVYSRISGRTYDSGRDSLFKGIGEQIAKELKFVKNEY